MTDKPKPVLFMRLKHIFDQADTDGIELYQEGNLVEDLGLSHRLNNGTTEVYTSESSRRFPDQPTSVYSDGTFSVFDDRQDVYAFRMVKVERSVWLPEKVQEPVKVTWHDDYSKPIGDDAGGLWLIEGRMVGCDHESRLVCAQSQEQARQYFLDFIEASADWSPEEIARTLRTEKSISLVTEIRNVGTVEAL